MSMPEGSYGAYKTVYDPNDASVHGWIMLAVIDESYDEEKTDYRDGYSVTVPVRHSHTAYLFGQPKEDTLADEVEKRKTLEAELKDAKSVAEGFERESKQWHQKLLDALKQVENIKSSWESCKEEKGKLWERFHQMEKDLGKIREHLGTANMREILGHD
jgi:flagellar motility protein MotE (MotC chaperone)